MAQLCSTENLTFRFCSEALSWVLLPSSRCHIQSLLVPYSTWDKQLAPKKKTWHPKRKGRNFQLPTIHFTAGWFFSGGVNHSSHLDIWRNLRTSWKKCIEDAEQKDPREVGRVISGGNGWSMEDESRRGGYDFLDRGDVELPKWCLFYWFVYLHPYLGKWFNWTIIFFEMGWKHQLVTLNSCWPHLGQSQFCWASKNEEIS